jgi:hypothetical protein
MLPKHAATQAHQHSERAWTKPARISNLAIGGAHLQLGRRVLQSVIALVKAYAQL